MPDHPPMFSTVKEGIRRLHIDRQLGKEPVQNPLARLRGAFNGLEDCANLRVCHHDSIFTFVTKSTT